MNKKLIYYGLIGLGALDLILWVINDFAFGWLELVVGVNVISKFGAFFMIGFGVHFLRKESAKDKLDIDMVLDVEPGEQIIYKNEGTFTLITLTNKKIIFRPYNIEEATIKNMENIISDEKAIFLYSDIEKAVPVKQKDITIRGIGKYFPGLFGISLYLKDGTIANLQVANAELICAHISKLINSNNEQQ